jgi:hypothetical protein
VRYTLFAIVVGVAASYAATRAVDALGWNPWLSLGGTLVAAFAVAWVGANVELDTVLWRMIPCLLSCYVGMALARGWPLSHPLVLVSAVMFVVLTLVAFGVPSYALATMLRPRLSRR